MRPSLMRGAISGLAMFCALIAAVPAASAQETATRYVMADVVRVRAAPEKGANVIANLRIATPLKVATGGATPEGWTRILLDTDPPLTGYVATAFLGPQPPKAADLLARYEAAMAAGDLKDARTPMERLAALEPDKDEHLERLKALYTKLGDADGALRIDSHLKGGGIKYIGFCGGPLLASYQPGGKLRSWVTTGSITGFDAAPLPALRIGLQRGPLFVFEPSTGQIGLLPPAYTLNTEIVHANWRESTAGELAYGSFINLPDCDRKGGIVSNEPMEPVAFEEADRSRVEELVANEVAQAQDKYKGGYNMAEYNPGSETARAIPGTRRLLTVRAKAYGISVWRLYDATTGDRLAGVGGGSSYALGFKAVVREVTWFKWRNSDARVAIVDYYVSSDASDNGSYVDIVVIEKDKSVRRRELRLDWTTRG